MNPQPQVGDYGCVSIAWLHKRVFGYVIPVPNFFGYGIRLFTLSRYDHSFIYVGDNKIVEAQAKGATLSNLSEYNGDKVIWSADNPPELVSKEIVAKAKSLIGTPYGFLDLVYLGLATLGLRFGFILRRVESEDRLICSQLVAVCGSSAGIAGWLCGKTNPCLVTPADLAKRGRK